MTETPPSLTAASSPWPHRLAVVMVCATFPLIWVGGLVTTYDAGMAVPDWPSTYGYNMFLYPLSTWLSGPWDLLIEHGHRLLASLVGLLTIAFVATVWRYEDRTWLKWYSLLCLLLVVGQGVLGGMRVLLDENVLARLHGCLGPLFFVSTVGAAAFTSTWWRVATGERANSASVPTHTNLRLLSAATAIAYLQLVIGAHLRHMNPSWSPQVFRAIVLAHLLVAFVLLIYAVRIAFQSSNSSRSLRVPQRLLGAMIVAQILLGAGVWRVKYYWPTWLPQPEFLAGYTVAAESMAQTITVTAHVALGSLILASAAYLTLRCGREIAASSRKMQKQCSTNEHASPAHLEATA